MDAPGVSWSVSVVAVDGFIGLYFFIGLIAIDPFIGTPCIQQRKSPKVGIGRKEIGRYTCHERASRWSLLMPLLMPLLPLSGQSKAFIWRIIGVGLIIMLFVHFSSLGITLMKTLN